LLIKFSYVLSLLLGGKLFVFKELISRQAAKGHKEKAKKRFYFIKPELGKSA
jgi:hypothetical protein